MIRTSHALYKPFSPSQGNEPTKSINCRASSGLPFVCRNSDDSLLYYHRYLNNRERHKLAFLRRSIELLLHRNSPKHPSHPSHPTRAMPHKALRASDRRILDIATLCRARRSHGGCHAPPVILAQAALWRTLRKPRGLARRYPARWQMGATADTTQRKTFALKPSKPSQLTESLRNRPSHSGTDRSKPMNRIGFCRLGSYDG